MNFARHSVRQFTCENRWSRNVWNEMYKKYRKEIIRDLYQPNLYPRPPLSDSSKHVATQSDGATLHEETAIRRIKNLQLWSLEEKSIGNGRADGRTDTARNNRPKSICNAWNLPTFERRILSKAFVYLQTRPISMHILGSSIADREQQLNQKYSVGEHW